MGKTVQEEIHVLNERIRECENIERSLRESESRFRTLVEHIPAITYMSALDKNGTILYVSPQIRKLLQYSPDEYKADPDLWRKQLHPDDHNRVMAELVSSRVADKNFVSDYRKIARDGRVVWFHDEAVTVKNEQDKPLFLQGVMYDITQQKMAEKALENAFGELEKRVNQRTADLNRINESLKKEISERRRAEKVASKLASFPILNPMPIVEIELPRRITYINPEGIRLFSDILIVETEHPFLKGIPEIAQKLKAEDKQSFTREIEIGGIWYAQFVYRMDNEAIRVYALDITERKRFEQALRENQQELLAIIESSPIPQFVIDQNHSVIYWNKALERSTGKRSETMVGTKNHCSAFYNYQRPCLADLLLDENIAEISRWYPGRFSQSKVVSNAYEAVDFFAGMGSGGLWLHFTAALIRDAHGAVIGAIETLQDISEQKQAEQALKKSEELFKTVANYVFAWEYWLDTDKKLIYTTPSCERFTGYRPEDFYANPGLLTKVVHPDDRKMMLDHLAGVTENDDEVSFDLRVVSAAGRETWINHICHPVFNEAGKYLGRRISNTDISRLKQEEARLETCRREHSKAV